MTAKKGGGSTVARVFQTLRSSLQYPDQAHWRRYRTYSIPLAFALRSAYAAIHDQRYGPDRYLHAYAALVPHRARVACVEQRMRLEYALALAYTGESAIPQALDSLAFTLELAALLDDCGAQVEAAFLAGALLSGLALHASAFEAYSDALSNLRLLAPGADPVDPAFELDILLRLAGRAWELGWFPVCLRLLDEAYAFRVRWAPNEPRPGGVLFWLDAQLARVRGDPITALQHSWTALSYFSQLDLPLNTGRLLCIVAEIESDVAEAGVLHIGSLPTARRWGTGTEPGAVYDLARCDPQDLSRQARRHARTSEALARQVDDKVGVGMAQLALDRGFRAVGRGRQMEESLAAIESVKRTARRVGDTSLLGRAETAIGETLQAAGRPEAAALAYHRAVMLLAENQLDGLAFRPRRALKALYEDSM